MSRWDNPSFSSSLLDKIYRSIDDGERTEDSKFYRDNTVAKRHTKSGRVTDHEEKMAALRRACLIEKWIEKKTAEKAEAQQHQKQSRNLDDEAAVFFSSNSCSSDSSSGGFSSSDAESMYGGVSRPSRASCLVPSLWPKPIKTTRSVKTEEKKTGRKQSALFHEQREFHFFDDYRHTRVSNQTTLKLDEAAIKSKSRALKIYENLKKVKQPMSPGGRVANFLNSLFTTGQIKKSSKSTTTTTSASSLSGYEDVVQLKSGYSSTCSSASSFSRSCLSKNSPNTREKLRNGVKKSVQFYPVSVIVGDDSQQRGQKCLYEEHDAHLMPVTVATAWQIGRSQSRRTEEEIVKQRVLEKSRQAEEAAREFLKDHRRNQLKNELLAKTDYNDDMDDDAASCSSSDLFELDHLAVIGNERYLEELPVYETTRASRTNRAIF